MVFSSAEAARGILCSSLRADGSSARLLERTMWGTRFPFPPGTTDLSGSLLKMDGRQVYTFAVKAVAEGMAAMLASAGLFGAGLTYGGKPHPLVAAGAPHHGGINQNLTLFAYSA